MSIASPAVIYVVALLDTDGEEWIPKQEIGETNVKKKSNLQHTETWTGRLNIEIEGKFIP